MITAPPIDDIVSAVADATPTSMGSALATALGVQVNNGSIFSPSAKPVFDQGPFWTDKDPNQCYGFEKKLDVCAPAFVLVARDDCLLTACLRRM